MRVHSLKTWPEYFDAVCSGVKRFEYRKNDRDFQPFHSWMVADDYPDEYRRIAMGHTGHVDTSGNAHRPTMRTKHYSPMTPGLMQLAIRKKA